MEKNVFLIKWYGPFTSRKEVKEWEQEQQFNCSLYLLHGKPKFAKTREKYYCGMSIRNIYKRLQDKGHHIEEIKDRLNSIYVGYLSNLKHPIKCQILLAEKIITASLADIVGEENVLNATNTLFPSENVFVINEWWKTNGVELQKRTASSIPAVLPEVLEYYAETKALYGVKRLKYIVDL